MELRNFYLTVFSLTSKQFVFLMILSETELRDSVMSEAILSMLVFVEASDPSKPFKTITVLNFCLN